MTAQFFIALGNSEMESAVLSGDKQKVYISKGSFTLSGSNGNGNVTYEWVQCNYMRVFTL